MHPVFAKTFGGLSRAYYFRQFIFGLLFPLMMFAMFNMSSRPIPMPGFLIVLFAINTLLYPYSRFVYEGIVGFILGNNVFFVNAFFMLVVKFMTMALCWSAAIFVAPIGLAYLYFRHGGERA